MTEWSNPECQTILAGISAYLDGELDRTACDAIERHCDTCPRCTALVTELRETVGLCQQASSIPIPDAVRQRASASVRRLLDGDRNVSTK